MVSLLLDLRICSNYPNGLFHFSCFKIGPWAEYFPVINGCSVECMHPTILTHRDYQLQIKFLIELI